MTLAKRRRVEQILIDLDKSEMNPDNKLSILLEVLKVSLPPDSHLLALVPRTDGATGESTNSAVRAAIERIQRLLPLYDEDSEQPLTVSSNDLTTRIKDEIDRALRDPAREALLNTQADERIWRGLNDKFTRTPWFQIAIGAAAVAVTLFTFGLINLNKDVKRADEIVSAFQQRLAKADQDLTKDERDMTARLDVAIQGATAKISMLQTNAIKGLNDDLQRRITEVDAARTTTINTINAAKADTLAARNDAIQAINDQPKLAAPEIARIKQLAIDAITKEGDAQKQRYNERAGQIIADLKEPSLRNVLGKAFLLLIGATFLSVCSLGYSIWRNTSDSQKKKALDAFHNAVADTLAAKDQAIQEIREHPDLAFREIKRATRDAIDVITKEGQTQRQRYTERAASIIADLPTSSFQSVLGKTFWLMLATILLSVAALGIAILRHH